MKWGVISSLLIGKVISSSCFFWWQHKRFPSHSPSHNPPCQLQKKTVLWPKLHTLLLASGTNHLKALWKTIQHNKKLQQRESVWWIPATYYPGKRPTFSLLSRHFGVDHFPNFPDGICDPSLEGSKMCWSKPGGNGEPNRSLLWFGILDTFEILSVRTVPRCFCKSHLASWWTHIITILYTSIQIQ